MPIYSIVFLTRNEQSTLSSHVYTRMYDRGFVQKKTVRKENIHAHIPNI